MKMNKKTLASILVANFLVVSTPVKAFWGVSDLNIDGMMNLQYLQNGLGFDMGGGLLGNLNSLNSSIDQTFSKIASMPSDLAKNMSSVSKIEMLAKRAIDLQERRNDPNYCSAVGSGLGVMQGSANSSQKFAESMQHNAAKQNRVTTSNTQIIENRKVLQELSCSDNDVEKGINGCSAVGEYPGGHVNPIVLRGGVKPMGSQGSQTLRQVNFSIPASSETKQLDIGEKYLDLKTGKLPSELAGKDKNLGGAGQNYNDQRYTYLNRLNTATIASRENMSKYTAMNKSDFDSKPQLKSFWNSISNEDYKSVYGDDFEKPEVPSEMEILQLTINKHFIAGNIARNVINGGKASETELLALSVKLQLEQLKQQQATNDILGSILEQLMNPVTLKDLTNEQNKANLAN